MRIRALLVACLVAASSLLIATPIADGCNDILAEAAGITAGSWYASPATHVGYELIGAGMLIVAGGGRGLGETLRINDRRLCRPGGPDDRGHAVGFDQFDLQLIVVDLG